MDQENIANPTELLHEAAGMAYALMMLSKDEREKDVLEKIGSKIACVLINSNIYKKQEVK